MILNERLTPREFAIGIIILTIIAALLRIYWLATTSPTGDELYAVADAFDYMVRGHSGLIEWQHPKLNNIAIYSAMSILGSNVEGMRFASVFFGTLTVPLVALVARTLTKSQSAALLAALFMAIDPIYILFSRQSIQEIYMPFFLLLGFYLTFRYMETRKPAILFCAGIFFGLGLASKWMGLAVQLFLILILLVYRNLKDGDQDIRARSAELLLYFSTLVVLPATIYVLSYAPWFLYRGYDIGEWLTLQKVSSLENMIHQGANSFIQVQDHSAALWFVRPIGFADFIMNGNAPIIILGFSNPFVWLLTLPATGYFIYNIRKLDRPHSFLLALFCCSYLPFALSRRVTAANTSLGVIPFAFMLVASFVITLSEGKPKARYYFCIYLSIVILTAVPLYFMTIGKGYGTFLQPLLELYRPLNER